MLGKLRNTEIENLLKTQFIGRIGCYADGVTYVVPVSYIYDGTNIYGFTFEGMKIDMMRKNSEVCFEVEDTCNLANWQTVIAWGEFRELEGKERNEVLQKLHSRVLPFISSETMRVSPLSPFELDNPEDIEGIVFRIRLGKKTGRFEKSTGSFSYGS